MTQRTDEESAGMRDATLQSDAAHREALGMIEALWGAEEGTAAGDRLERLVSSVEAYETWRWPIKPLDRKGLSLLPRGCADKG